jgi:hypothetical protein
VREDKSPEDATTAAQVGPAQAAGLTALAAGSARRPPPIPLPRLLRHSPGLPLPPLPPNPFPSLSPAPPQVADMYRAQAVVAANRKGDDGGDDE